MLKVYMVGESLGTPVLNLNLGNSDRLLMKVFVVLIDSQHGSLICTETSGKEYEQNGERELIAANNFIVGFLNFAKTKILPYWPADHSGLE